MAITYPFAGNLRVLFRGGSRALWERKFGNWSSCKELCSAISKDTLNEDFYAVKCFDSQDNSNGQKVSEDGMELFTGLEFKEGFSYNRCMRMLQIKPFIIIIFLRITYRI